MNLLDNNTKHKMRELMENLGCSKSKISRHLVGLLTEWEAFACSINHSPITWDYYLNRLQERLLIEELVRHVTNNEGLTELSSLLSRLKLADKNFRERLQPVDEQTPQGISEHLTWIFKRVPRSLNSVERQRWRSHLAKIMNLTNS